MDWSVGADEEARIHGEIQDARTCRGHGEAAVYGPLTTRQKFAPKSEKPLCFAAVSAKQELVVRSEKLKTASLLGEEKSVKLPQPPESESFFSLPFLSTVSTSLWQTLTQNHKGQGILGNGPSFSFAMQIVQVGGSNAKLATNNSA